MLLRKLGLGLVVAVVLFLAIGLLLPRQVRVERSVTVAAPPATVYVQVDGFRTFQKWSPWFARDAAARYAFEGPEFGAGATMRWESDPHGVGKGSQRITLARPYDRVESEIDFGPQGAAFAAFRLAPEDGGTKVTWELEADLGANPLSRWFGLAFDRRVGPDFERGLANLKRLAESLPKTDFSGLAVESVVVAPVPVAYVVTSCDRNDAATAAAIDAAYADVRRFMAASGLRPSGPPIVFRTSESPDRIGLEAAIPVDRAPEGESAAGGRARIKRTQGGRALRAGHRGAHGGLAAIREQLAAYAAARAYAPAGSIWDEYVGEPGTTPEAELETRVYLPIR